MKAVILLACLLVVVIAEPPIPIVHHSDVRDSSGQFSLSYQSGDGSSFSEQGVLKPNAAGDDHVLVKKGSYSYISPEGKTISVEYVSDEHGFQPTGDHIPIAPAH